MKTEVIRCECTFCKCQKEVIRMSDLSGWLKVIKSKWIWRDYLGWCPKCSKKFKVE